MKSDAAGIMCAKGEVCLKFWTKVKTAKDVKVP